MINHLLDQEIIKTNNKKEFESGGIVINSNKWVNCYIKLFKHNDDKAGYYALIDRISNDDVLSICTVNEHIYLGFKSYGIDMEDVSQYKDKLKYRVIPFLFRYDSTSKKFQDTITGTYFSFHTYDDGVERKFYEDKGEMGEYIDASLILTDEEAKSIRKNMSTNDVQTYRRALRILESTISEVYKECYFEISKSRSDKERTRNNRNFGNGNLTNN